MPSCLITGCGGFIGSHLAQRLLAHGWSVYGTVHKARDNLQRLSRRLKLFECHILHGARVRDAVAAARAQVVFHLAARTSIPASWLRPQATFRVNVFGTLHVLEALRTVAPEATLIAVTSSAIYGPSPQNGNPIKESHQPQPSSPYGVSKAAADVLARLYWQGYGLKVIRARPFFITGPGKRGDVCSDFCHGAVEIENRQRESLPVGNLETVRDFVDVRDAVAALQLLAQSGRPGEAYNICSGTGTSVSALLDMVTAAARTPVPVRPDPGRCRPLDDPVMVGDRAKINALGWQPSLTLEQTVADTLDFWRREAREPHAQAFDG